MKDRCFVRPNERGCFEESIFYFRILFMHLFFLSIFGIFFPWMRVILEDVLTSYVYIIKYFLYKWIATCPTVCDIDIVFFRFKGSSRLRIRVYYIEIILYLYILEFFSHNRCESNKKSLLKTHSKGL